VCGDARRAYRWSARRLVRDDLDALDVAGGLENLAQHVLGDSGVQSTDVQGSLVGLGGSAARHVAGLAAGWGHWVAGHRGADGGGDGVGVLRDDDRGQRGGRHVLLLLLLALVAIVAGGAARWGRRQ